MADALDFTDSPSVCFVFYEELLYDVPAVVRRLASFTGWSANDVALHDSVAFSIEDDDCTQPRHHKVVGSSGEGALQLSRESIARLDEAFMCKITARFPRFESYVRFAQHPLVPRAAATRG